VSIELADFAEASAHPFDQVDRASIDSLTRALNAMLAQLDVSIMR
jgi:hypothetical protein